MPHTNSALSARYLKALHTYLARQKAAAGETARALGHSAVSAGLVTLDLAIIHEHSVLTLAPSFDFTDAGSAFLKRAGVFFTQALVPLEKEQRTTRQNIRNLRQRNETLRLHTAALATANRRLERAVAGRKSGELALLRSQDESRALYLESQLMQKKLRKLTHQIISAQENERKEISRELHDEVVQPLVGINVELAALGRGASNGVLSLHSNIARTQRLVETSVNAVHRFARELRPAVLDDLGLIPALHAYSKNLAARKNLTVGITAFGGVEALPIARRTVLFRVAQEALTNVARHACATCVTIAIQPAPGSIRMEIHDNGKSFPVAAILNSTAPKRLGLVGMNERVLMIGGRLTIESSPGKGTTVRAVIPFRPKTPKP